jgi:hypothetical protein
LYYKILVYGHSGAGKTWLASSAPNPIVLLTEQNGVQSVRMSNPDARFAYTSNIQDVRDLLKAAQSRALGTDADPVDTIVIDGLTEIQRLFKDEMLRERGGEEFSIPMWGELTEKMRRLLRLLRDLPYHVVCTALAETEMEGETRHVFPAFQGRKLYDEVMQYFNAVGYCYKQPKGDGIEHVAMFDGPSRFAAKNCHPLKGTRSGPVTGWITELRGAQVPAALPLSGQGQVDAQDAVSVLAPTTQPGEAPATGAGRRLAGRKGDKSDSIPA